MVNGLVLIVGGTVEVAGISTPAGALNVNGILSMNGHASVPVVKVASPARARENANDVFWSASTVPDRTASLATFVMYPALLAVAVQVAETGTFRATTQPLASVVNDRVRPIGSTMAIVASASAAFAWSLTVIVIVPTFEIEVVSLGRITASRA